MMNASNALVAVLVHPVALVIGKATLCIGGAALLMLALRSSSAALRHFVWALSLVGAVAVVLTDRVAPRVDVPIRVTASAVTSADAGAPAMTVSAVRNNAATTRSTETGAVE